MATINITSFCSLVYASFVVTSMIAGRADGIAASSALYVDLDCTEPITTADLFKALTNELGNFNECSTDGNTSHSTICDTSTGEYGINFYADTECVELVQDNTISQTCSAEVFNTTSSGREILNTLECSDKEPSVISPNVVNYLAEEYNDDACANPTGNTEILSSGSNGTCIQDGPTSSLSECMADGSVISHQFVLGDETCSGDVWIESQIIYGTYLTPCTLFESDAGLYYYNIISCTTDSATLFGTFETLASFTTASFTTAPFTTAPAATGLTPAPSANNDSDAMPTIITDAPSPVAIQETGAPITEVPARTTMETPAPAASEEAEISPNNTVTPATTTSDTFFPSATEVTVAPDNTGAPNNSRAEAASGATRAKNTGVAAGAVAAICGLGLVVGRMRQ